MARLKVFALALAAVAANDSVNVVDGNTNGFDGAPCAAEQTQCDDGGAARRPTGCHGVVPPPYKTEMTVNGRTCYEKMRPDQECGSKDSDAAAPRAGIALLALGAAVAVAA